MARFNHIGILCLLLMMATQFFATSAATDPKDDSSLRSLYVSLGKPQHLTGWNLKGGDPCGSEPWRGVSCSGSSVVSINLKGLGVGGVLNSRFSGLSSLKTLDLSKNKIGGGIPLFLPINATNIDLSDNNLVGNLPVTIGLLKKLKHLNLSNNLFMGTLADVYKDMQSLEILDLSDNRFSGDLPTSFSSLTNLHELNLQQNEFTGTVDCLAKLPLSVLHIENNRFSGCSTEKFKSIPDLRTSGNRFQCSPPPNPSTPTRKPVVASPNSKEIPNHNHSHHKSLSMAKMAGIIGGAAIVVILIVIVIAVCIRRFCQINSVNIEILIRKSHNTDSLDRV